MINEENSGGTLTMTYIGKLADVSGSNPSTGTWRYYGGPSGRLCVAAQRDGRLSPSSAPGLSSLGQYEYTPYGEIYAESGASIPWKYTGHMCDDTADLYYAPFRYYNPSIARWTTRDALRTGRTSDFYPYGRNSPISTLDRNGSVTVSFETVYAGAFQYFVTGSAILNKKKRTVKKTEQVYVWRLGCFRYKGILPWQGPGAHFGYNLRRRTVTTYDDEGQEVVSDEHVQITQHEGTYFEWTRRWGGRAVLKYSQPGWSGIAARTPREVYTRKWHCPAKEEEYEPVPANLIKVLGLFSYPAAIPPVNPVSYFWEEEDPDPWSNR
ncbi:MAG TPA: hypothetical protein HPP83_03315 [Candidatus Hydrogenedentes bacterium]|nr:hypothetical protein [Candidatus Hydrogenedentota bacterium]